MDSANSDRHSSLSHPGPVISISFNDVRTTAPESISRNQLRRRLEQLLLADASVDAFCLDYFPEVHKQFSAGMERTRKFNLLLLISDPTELNERLAQYEIECSALEQPSLPQNLPHVVFPINLLCRRLGLLGLSGALMTMFIGGTSFQRERLHDHAPPISATPVPPPLSPPAPVMARVPWLTSEPSGAIVIDAQTGRELGQTPWPSEPRTSLISLPAGPLRLCLRLPEFRHALVTLDFRAETALPIHVRLHTEAAREPDLGQEECYDRTPLIL